MLQRLVFFCLFGVVSLTWMPSLQAASPVGKWRGGWTSGSNGHKGALRATVQPSSNGTYQARFSGRFALVIPFTYKTELKRVPGTCNCYTSAKKMPLLGTYRMQATVTPNRFYAVFQGNKDKGIFDMSR